MFEFVAFHVVVWLVVQHAACAQFEDTNNLTHLGSWFRNDTKSEIADEVKTKQSSSEKHYVVEYSDYMDVPNFQKHENGRFDYFNFVPGVNFVRKSVKNEQFLINKCCSWSSYFEINDLRCVQLSEELSNSSYLPNTNQQLYDGENETNYLFLENLPSCKNHSVLSIRIVSNVSVDSSGLIVDGKGPFKEYCVDGTPKHPNSTVVLICDNPDSYCASHVCFRKCCPVGMSFVLSNRKCQKAKAPFNPKFYNLTNLTQDNSLSLAKFGIFLEDACGKTEKRIERGDKYRLEKEQGEVGYLGTDGRLYVPSSEEWFSRDDFCVEYVTNQNISGIESFVCFPKNYKNFADSPLQFFLLSLGLFISCMFLLLTFIVYLFSPKSRNLHGKTLMCYIASLFTAYLCLAIAQLEYNMYNYNKIYSERFCKNLGYLILFSFLSAFFWLNVMSFDIWKTFRCDRSLERSRTEKERLQFFKYSLYAWIFPTVITTACGVVNELTDFPFDFMKPAIGENYCFFYRTEKGIYVFFITPITLIITCNIIFYIQTAWKIWKVKSEIKKMEKQKRKRFSANKTQFAINGKLFVVMGITWSLEILSFFTPNPIWYITDAANALNGVFIFAIFVLKRKVFQEVSQQLRLPLKRMKQTTSGNSEDLSTKKNFQNSNAEGKTNETNTMPMPGESKG